MPSAPPQPFPEPVYVTRPLVPALADYHAALDGIWERRWLTNKGKLHDELEAALAIYLRAPHLSLVASGTAGLILACRAVAVSGEAITTPLTSPATVNALHWCGLTPVFADIDPVTLTLDPAAVARAVTPATSAIVGVHLYGRPCDVEALQAIATRHDLRVVYDCAHAFGTEIAGRPIADFGHASVFSFHATKLFNTAEGGAVATPDPAIKRDIDLLRNIGIQDETTVALPGINARMNELEAAFGLANLKAVESERRARAEIANVYRERLTGIAGLTCLEMPPAVRDSQHYFVVRVDNTRGRISRDEMHEGLKTFNILSRRYFYPLCSELPFYRQLPSSHPDNLPQATRAANEVLCLPFYGSLGREGAGRIAEALTYLVDRG
jgi:dTDP-4-amino-4,6-dideoxygalactose transaminase